MVWSLPGTSFKRHTIIPRQSLPEQRKRKVVTGIILQAVAVHIEAKQIALVDIM